MSLRFKHNEQKKTDTANKQINIFHFSIFRGSHHKDIKTATFIRKKRL